jgi:hypothetical protein
MTMQILINKCLDPHDFDHDHDHTHEDPGYNPHHVHFLLQALYQSRGGDDGLSPDFSKENVKDEN